MTALAPTLQAYFTDRLIRQRRLTAGLYSRKDGVFVRR